MHQTAGNGGGGYGNYERLESEHLKAFSQQFLQPGTQPVQEAQQPPLEFIALPTMIPPSTQPTQNPPMPTPMPAASLKPNQPYQPYPTSATNSTAALYPGVSADQLPTPPVKRVRVASRNRIWICGVLLIAVAVAVTVGVVTSKKNDDKAPPGGGGSSSGSGGGGGGGSSSLSPEYWDCRSKCSDTLEQCRNVCESQQEYKTCISNCAGNFTANPSMGRWSGLGLLHQKAIITVACLVVVNVIVWIVAVILARSYPSLAGSMAIAYTLGLRHAVDADHLAAIDNVTRKLMYQQHKDDEALSHSSSSSSYPSSSSPNSVGERSSSKSLSLSSPPVCVGLFFSLGHSTVVIVASVILAATATALKDKLEAFGQTGGIIGTSVSAAFLFLIGIINLVILIQIGRELYLVRKTGQYHYVDPLEGVMVRTPSLEDGQHQHQHQQQQSLKDYAGHDGGIREADDPTKSERSSSSVDSIDQEEGSSHPKTVTTTAAAAATTTTTTTQHLPPLHHPARTPALVGGLFARLFRPLFNLIDRSWKMYPLGLLFGLGFDTATQISVLGIAAVSAHQQFPMGVILIFPALFTAAMSLIDTLDGILMANAYGWAFIHPVRKLWYNFVITFLGVIVALIVGMVQLFSLLADQLHLEGKFWEFFSMLADHFTIIGAVIVALFAITWAIAVVAYHYGPLKRLESRVVVVQHIPSSSSSSSPPQAQQGLETDLEKGGYLEKKIKRPQ
ncbi:hypothetical protein DFQ27_002118 [Actinomortierella ambigua]|uniref:Nickel/cobalt efflux system n=1 Tax=Actinomortierella ambigua TaxID=1343610 RepID=A0A9P6U7C9_9FUNG|nr:hypothetical protein DFQ27_002118 [Actinomortierella ambigua]